MKYLLRGALLFVTFLLARGESFDQHDVWKDPNSDVIVTATKGPPAKDAQSVRNQIAGVLDMLLEQAIIPTEFGQTKVGGLPAYYIRGILLVEPETQTILEFVLFSETNTHIGFVTGLEDAEFSYVETHVKVSGTPNPAATEVLADIVKRTQAGLPELKRMARSKNRAAIEKIQTEVRKDNEAVEVAKTKRGDLTPSEVA